MTHEPGLLTNDEVVEFARHVAGLADSGLALPAGLRALGQELPGGPLARATAALAGRLEEGESIDQALKAPGHRFPPHLAAIVRAGLRAGRLGEVLNRFVEFERDAAELRRRLWLALAYPLILLGTLAGLFAFSAHVIVKEFDTILKDFGLALPAITRALLGVSRAIVDAGWGLLLAPAVGLGVLWLGGRGLFSASWRRRISSGIPLIGPLRRWTALAEYCHLLALLLEYRLPLPEALVLAGDAVRDADLADASRRLARAVEAGAPLGEATEHRRLFPIGFGRLLDWSQAHRSLPEVLNMAGDTFAARARAQATLVGIVSLVAAVILVIWGVMFILLGLYLPLVRLISVLS
jgi:type II secretory pathway component PulF